MTENKKLFIEIFVVLLIIGNAFFAYRYFTISKELQTAKIAETKTELNAKVIDFTSMFINKVLQADKEVDFETRLSLENAVRDLNDTEIMAEWNNFTGSKTEADAQNSVKTLLGILVSKIQK